MDYGKEFEKYAMSDYNISSMKMDYIKQQLENSMTPYILEEREMRATQIDIFSRLIQLCYTNLQVVLEVIFKMLR